MNTDQTRATYIARGPLTMAQCTSCVRLTWCRDGKCYSCCYPTAVPK